MKLLTTDPKLAEALEGLGCRREPFPTPVGLRLLVVVGPPKLLLHPQRPRRLRRA